MSGKGYDNKCIGCSTTCLKCQDDTTTSFIEGNTTCLVNDMTKDCIEGNTIYLESLDDTTKSYVESSTTYLKYLVEDTMESCIERYVNDIEYESYKEGCTYIVG